MIAPAAEEVNFAVTDGLVPAPAVIGAVQTLCSVLSGPVKWLTSVNWSPAESVTLFVVAFVLFHTPTSTTRRLPAPSAEAGVTEIVLADAFLLTCWTKLGAAVAEGVTAFDGDDAGPVPMALVALTVNVYEVPLVRPPMVAVVAGGEPLTTVGVCAAPRRTGSPCTS